MKNTLSMGIVAGLLLTAAAAANAGQDRELNLHAYELETTPALGSEAVTAAMKQATALASRTLVGDDSELAHVEFAAGAGVYEVELAPASDDQHRILTLRYRTEGTSSEGHPTRNAVTIKPREIATGHGYLFFAPVGSRNTIAICTGAIGECPVAARAVSSR